MPSRASVLLLLLLLPACVTPPSLPSDPDTDGDGLSDFQERHKYHTNPQSKDTDGDGIPDGDWLERREYTYNVRSVVQVMRPVTPETLSDDYQDVRVLDETPEYIELEVIHYPLNTVASALRGDPDWRAHTADLQDWLAPGPTSDWTPALREAIRSACAQDGIHPDSLDDLQLVQQLAAWLLRRARPHDGFTTFLTAFDPSGRPSLPDELRAAADRGRRATGLTLEAQWAREISAAGMFTHRTRGSCTSSAIYLNGCLRALGVPTRTILCIPVVDASDPREMAMVGRLRHHVVRDTIESALSGQANSWTSHTFNEVFVGGRWRRLNYAHLGQNILDADYLGLMTKIATFRDWADAKMPATVGRRQGLQVRDDVFGGPNPYSTIALRDEFGVHARIDNPALPTRVLTVERLEWTDTSALPDPIRTNCRERGRFGLMARVTGIAGSGALHRFMSAADLEVVLEVEGRPALRTGFDPGCWWYDAGAAWIYLPISAAARRDLDRGATYRVAASNGKPGFRWRVAPGIEVRRPR